MRSQAEVSDICIESCRSIRLRCTFVDCVTGLLTKRKSASSVGNCGNISNGSGVDESENE